MKIVFRIIKRLLALPFAFGLLLVTHLCFVFHRTALFLWYGGKFDHHTKASCYDTIEHELKNCKENYKNQEKRIAESEDYVNQLVKRVERQQEIITKHQTKQANKKSDDACEGK